MTDESKTQLYRPERRLSSSTSGASSLFKGRCMEDPIYRRREQRTRLSPARRVCCNAFGLGLSYGISVASLLAIIFVFVELSSVKTELDVLRGQLHGKQQQRQLLDDVVDNVNSSESDGRGDVIRARSGHKSDVRLSAVSGSVDPSRYEHRGHRHHHRHHQHHRVHVDGTSREQLASGQQNEDLAGTAPSDVGQHGNSTEHHGAVKSRAERSVTQSQGRHSNTVRNLGVTQDQVQQLIRHSTSMLYHPSAHMAYQPARNGSSFGDGNALHWTEHHNSRLTHNQLFGYGDSYGSLVVQSSGTYLIYVQITYNGRSVVRQPTCSHAVKLFPTESPNESKSLLYGSVTQYNQGRTIHTNSDGIPVRAFDSVFQAGIFHLEIGDQLRVEMDDFSRNCHIKSTIDRTFFGALRIQYKDLDL